MSSRRIDAPLRSFLGFAAVVATVALAMPGLQVARAADEAPAASGTGLMSVDPMLVQASPTPPLVLPKARRTPSCEDPGQPSMLDDALAEHQAQQMLREIARRAIAQHNAPQSTEQGIVLNGRGYNYRPTKLRTGP